MSNWSRLILILDSLFDFPNRAASEVKQLQQAFDASTGEHVIWLEYRIQVKDGYSTPPDPVLLDTGKDGQMLLLRELLAQARRPGLPA